MAGFMAGYPKKRLRIVLDPLSFFAEAVPFKGFIQYGVVQRFSCVQGQPSSHFHDIFQNGEAKPHAPGRNGSYHFIRYCAVHIRQQPDQILFPVFRAGQLHQYFPVKTADVPKTCNAQAFAV